MSDMKTLEATFTIDEWNETAYDEPSEGPKLTKVVIRKTYTGEITGSSVAEILTTQGKNGSGYVASERIVGSLGDKSGSFVIQHGGLMDESGNQSTFGTIVPGSGTGELTAIAGEAVEAQHEVLTLRLSSL